MPSSMAQHIPDSTDDPLSNALRPPPGETSEQKEVRLSLERKAKQKSDTIDEELEKQRLAEKRGPKAIKILLLGQSESGKSTTLKNFQLMHDPSVFRTERASWRAVIQLNIVRSIRLIIDAMNYAHAASQRRSSIMNTVQLTPDLLKLKMRLSPLVQVEEALIRKLTPLLGPEVIQAGPIMAPKEFTREITVNSTIQWKNAFNHLLRPDRKSFDSEDLVDWNDPNDPGVVLHACVEDMITLWNTPLVHQVLHNQNLRLEEVSGFFLDSLERVAGPKYVPTDDDILRARLKTVGVSEHRFKLGGPNSTFVSPHGHAYLYPDAAGRDWRIFDVGGHRSQRAAWAPYFDDMDAIIFLAPISCFDQVLAEDHKVNRLEDSVNLWKKIVTNPLLKNTNLILFLNKIDIFRAKLDSGIKLADYVVSYHDKPNDYDNATTYLRRKFAGILKDFSPSPRIFYCHFTSVTDTKSTKFILANVKDLIIRQNLTISGLIP